MPPLPPKRPAPPAGTPPLRPFYRSPGGEATLYAGHVLDVLGRLPEKSVHCCITSPPYWGLRDYGTGTWEGGDPACDHKGGPIRTGANVNENCGTGATVKGKDRFAPVLGGACPKCGATKTDHQLGAEPSPDCGTQGRARCGLCFVCNLVGVFRAVRRVLRDDGTAWLNLGDTYTGSGVDTNHSGTGGAGSAAAPPGRNGTRKPLVVGQGSIGRGNLVGVPWRVALALQADGWVLRQDVIWHKPAPMPESVRNRCTKAHEYVFLLAKGPGYFYDAEAIKQTNTPGTIIRLSSGSVRATKANPKNVVRNDGGGEYAAPKGSNKRSVWTVSSQGFPGAHFATYPPELIRPMIRAGTSERGCCGGCGTPWRRVVASDRRPTRPGVDTKIRKDRDGGAVGLSGERSADGRARFRSAAEVGNRDPRRHCTATETVGWSPGCGCGTDLLPNDLEVVATPVGTSPGRYDPKRTGCPRPYRPTGGTGNERPRAADEGVRYLTRYERRKYAEQLRGLPKHVQRLMKERVGAEAFAHYRKPGDDSGRPIPGDILEGWIGEGWLTRVAAPTAAGDRPPVVPCVVLDPFAGSGTTLEVAGEEGRHSVGIDLNDAYLRDFAVGRAREGLARFAEREAVREREDRKRAARAASVGTDRGLFGG